METRLLNENIKRFCEAEEDGDQVKEAFKGNSAQLLFVGCANVHMTYVLEMINEIQYTAVIAVLSPKLIIISQIRGE